MVVVEDKNGNPFAKMSPPTKERWSTLATMSSGILTEKKSGHPMFYQLLEKMSEIHSVKNQDYGGGDPLGNFKTSADFVGIDPFTGILVRLSDKWSRITNIHKKGMNTVKDETIEDSLLDLACYALLAIVIRRETTDSKK